MRNMSFALNLFAGLLVFNWAAEFLSRAPRLMTDQPNLVTKVVFPLQVLPWSALLSSFFHAMVSCFVWLAGCLLFGQGVHASWLALPLVFLALVPTLLGLGWALSALVALPLGWLDRARLREFAPADWLEALKLSAVGNFLYYLCLAAAIQRAGGPLPTMVIGTLTVVIAISSNLRDAQRDGRLPWLKLLKLCVAVAALVTTSRRSVRKAPALRVPTRALRALFPTCVCSTARAKPWNQPVRVVAPRWASCASTTPTARPTGRGYDRPARRGAPRPARRRAASAGAASSSG